MEGENLVDSNAQDSVVSEDKVSYDSFRKSVEAEKKARTRANDLESQLESLRTKELEEKQQWQTLADEYKQKFQQVEQDLKRERETAKWNMVTSAIKTKARESGCVDPDKLIKIFDKSDFELLQAEQGQIKDESLSALMDKAKKENPFFFGSQQVRINDALPAGGQGEKSSNEMSKEDILNELRKQ